MYSPRLRSSIHTSWTVQSMNTSNKNLPTTETEMAEATELDMASICENESKRSQSVSAFSSAHSYTSTIGYNQEPWDEYKPRVEKLCDALWPIRTTVRESLANCLRTSKLFRSLLPPPQIPLIERLQGGDYNRITGITLPLSYGQESQKLILRTNRWGEGRPDREVAILDYVSQQTSIPVPEIYRKDFSCDNALEKPYVIQKRIPGSDLDSIWDSLSHRQQCMVARELGCVVKTLLSLEGSTPGLIEPMPKIDHNPPGFKIVPFEMKEFELDELDELVKQVVQNTPSALKSTSAASQTTGDFFKSHFERLHAYSATGPFERPTVLFKNLLETVCEMDSMGCLNADKYCLCHVDLHSRNIMAEVQSDTSVKITAILDWDEAVIAPKLMNCQPPWWLWKEEGDERIDEEVDWPYELSAAPGFPATQEKQELKRIFEEHAGPEWKHLAYDELSRLCRGLFLLAKDGLDTGEHYKAAERILREWKVLRQDLGYQVFRE